MNSELPNRDQLEADLAKQLARVSARHRAELEQLLGNPPDASRVPAAFWLNVQKEAQSELTAALALIFATSAEQSGLAAEDASLAALGWAEQRAAEISVGWAEHGVAMLETSDAAWRNRIDQQRQQQQIDAGDRQPAIGQQVTSSPITRREIRETSNRIFGPSRVEGVAVTETTNARSMGAEIGIEATVGLSDDDMWVTRGKHPCEVCIPLNGTLRPYWSRYYPDGPTAHPRCQCEIDYANVPAEASR
jgi:hypothetical protein